MSPLTKIKINEKKKEEGVEILSTDECGENEQENHTTSEIEVTLGELCCL